MSNEPKQKGNPGNLRPLRRYRVVAIEWLSHVAIIKAESREEAEAKAQLLWNDQSESESFRFNDSGLDGITAEMLPD